ncbi:hypothetical protein AOLI_G00176250 [Acnodon oligacanthus]
MAPCFMNDNNHCAYELSLRLQPTDHGGGIYRSVPHPDASPLNGKRRSSRNGDLKKESIHTVQSEGRSWSSLVCSTSHAPMRHSRSPMFSGSHQCLICLCTSRSDCAVIKEARLKRGKRIKAPMLTAAALSSATLQPRDGNEKAAC